MPLWRLQQRHLAPITEISPLVSLRETLNQGVKGFPYLSLNSLRQIKPIASSFTERSRVPIDHLIPGEVSEGMLEIDLTKFKILGESFIARQLEFEHAASSTPEKIKEMADKIFRGVESLQGEAFASPGKTAIAFTAITEIKDFATRMQKLFGPGLRNGAYNFPGSKAAICLATGEIVTGQSTIVAK